jgi:hypothetical protein
MQNYSYPETTEKSLTVQHQNESYLLVDSYDRFVLSNQGYEDNNSQNNNFVINHQKLNGFGQLTKVAVTDYIFPWVTPNVNIRNNYFFVNPVNAGQPSYIIVPEGWYTPNELANTMQALFNSSALYTNYPLNTQDVIHSIGWTVVIDPKTNQFIIGNTSFTFNTEPPDNAPDERLDGVIGFTASAGAFVPSITGGVPSMKYTTYIDICSNVLTRFQDIKDSLTQQSYTDVICRIYLEDGLNQPNTYFGSRPARIYRQIQSPKFMKWNPNEMIAGIDISYRDDSGNFLYIPEASSNVPANSPTFTLKLVEE